MFYWGLFTELPFVVIFPFDPDRHFNEVENRLKERSWETLLKGEGRRAEALATCPHVSLSLLDFSLEDFE